MLVVDTSVLPAAADNADPDHASCTRAFHGASPLVTTALVIAETAYLIGRQLGAVAEAAFFRAVAAGELQVKTTTPADAGRIAELSETYADLGLGGTDASLIIATIATLDHRHFGVVRPSHLAAFALIPITRALVGQLSAKGCVVCFEIRQRSAVRDGYTRSSTCGHAR